MATPLTNFEKWKQTATPDDIIKMSASLDNHGFKRKQSYIAFYCPNCPAHDYCAADNTNDSCRVMFRKWATKEAANQSTE